MIEKRVTLPELALVAGTRVALGIGLGLLLAGRLNDGERRAVGWTLFLAGALSTIPLAIEVIGRDDAAGGQPPRPRALPEAAAAANEPAHLQETALPV